MHMHRVMACTGVMQEGSRMDIMLGMMPGVWDYGKIMVRSAREQDDGAVGFSKMIYPYRSSLVAEPVAPHGVAGSRGQTDATRRGCIVVDDQLLKSLSRRMLYIRRSTVKRWH